MEKILERAHSPFRNPDGTLVPAHMDPEPDRWAEPGAWWAWLHRDRMRMTEADLVPTH